MVPVVTGFQGWHRGRITTLGRGGSDITAVAIAAALKAEACELVKDPGAVHTADPRLIPEAEALPRVTHRFVSEIALSGARVIHHIAAARAERDRVALRFTSLRPDGSPSTLVDGGGEPGAAGYAVVLGHGHHGFDPAADDPAQVATVSVVSIRPDAPAFRRAARAAAAGAGGTIYRTLDRAHALALLVPAVDGPGLARAVHTAVAGVALDERAVLRVSSGHG